MKFKIKLQGNDEFTSFCLIASAVVKYFDADNKNSTDGIIDYCLLASVERLVAKLMQTTLNQQNFKKRVTIAIDDCQIIALYMALGDEDFKLQPYESTLALNIVTSIEQQFFNSVALRYSNLQTLNKIALTGGNNLLVQ